MSDPTTLPLDPNAEAELDAERRRFVSRPLYVTVVEGPDVGLNCPLSGTVVVGSQVEADLKLTDSTVSRRHLELSVSGAGIQLRDLGSRNGTFVAGTRVNDAVLAEGSEVVLGNTVLRVARRPLEPIAEPARFGRALSVEPPMVELFAKLEKVARSDATVVLLGETGTGKELLAEAVHRHSTRAERPFVVFDCGAVAPSLVESDLFGHCKGAFTGAASDRAGAILSGHGGTLFLDEIGELPLDLQPKLLRVLESGTVRRVGEDAARQVDVRVIAATHRDLKAEVRAGRFREDLYFRLAVVSVRVPPLRERRADIPVLVRHFLREMHRPEFRLSESLMARFAAYDWPGNVRELRNLVESAVAAGDPEGALPEETARARTEKATVDEALQDLPFKEAKERLLESFTREYLSGLLQRTGGNVSEVARLAGVARSHINVLLARHGLKGSGK